MGLAAAQTAGEIAKKWATLDKMRNGMENI